MGALAVGASVAVAAWLGADAAAAAIRRVFAAVGPVVVLEIALALLVVGIGSSLVGSTARRRVAAVAGSRVARLRARGSSVRSVPPPVALAAIVSLAAAFRAVLGGAADLPQVLGDELIYSGLAKGWALHGLPFLRGTLEVGYSTLYPLFLAPAFRLADDGASALAAVKVMNALAMASAAVPAYLLARRVLTRRWALGVAALSAFVPWTAYSALTLTESLFYPLFVAYAAVVATALERPSWQRQVGMLALLAALVAVRTQGLALAAGTVLAILLYAALARSGRETLRSFVPTFALLAAVAAGGMAARAAGIALPTGTYDAVFGSVSRIGAMLEWAAWNVAALALAVGVVALAAFPLALRAMLRRGTPSAARATGAVALALGLSLLASVALLSAGPFGLGRLHERNLFYVVPLLLVCFAYWLSRGLERPRALALASAGAVVAVVAVLPHDVVIRSMTHDLPSSAFFLALDAEVPGVPFRVWTVGIAVVGAATLLLARRPLFPLLTVVLAFVAVTTRVDYADSITDAQARALAWIDHALPGGARTALVHLGLPYGIEPCASAAHREQHELVIWTEYFNTSIEPVRFVYEPNMFDGFGHHELTVGDGGLILDGGKPFAPEFVAIDSRQPVTGTEVARFDLSPLRGDERAGASLTLWRVDPPLRFYERPEPLPPRPDGRGC